MRREIHRCTCLKQQKFLFETCKSADARYHHTYVACVQGTSGCFSAKFSLEGGELVPVMAFTGPVGAHASLQHAQLHL